MSIERIRKSERYKELQRKALDFKKSAIADDMVASNTPGIAAYMAAERAAEEKSVREQMRGGRYGEIPSGHIDYKKLRQIADKLSSIIK